MSEQLMRFGDWEYTLLEDGTAEINGYHGTELELIVPADIEGHVVTSIGNGAFDSHEIYFVLEETEVDADTYERYEEVAHERFCTAKRRTSITLPQTIRTIGRCAFYRCEDLTTINIPDSVTSIGPMAFRFCKSLTAISIPDSVTVIAPWAFSYCYSLETLTIPDSVTAIGMAAFDHCWGLKTITIPASVIDICGAEFSMCHSLTTIRVPSGSYAEKYCMSYDHLRRRVVTY